MPTPDGKPTLSERLSRYVAVCDSSDAKGIMVEVDDLREAARILAARKRAEAQPEIAKLRELADAFLVVQDHYTVQPAELSGFFNAHAAALVALAEAERQVDAVSGLSQDFRWRAEAQRRTGGCPCDDRADMLESCASSLTSALASPGPSLRERVEAAVRDLRSRAQYLGKETDGEASSPAAIEACCARIDAALSGEVTE